MSRYILVVKRAQAALGPITSTADIVHIHTYIIYILIYATFTTQSISFVYVFSGWKRFSLLFGFLLTRRVFTGPLRSSRPMAWDEVCAAKTFQLSICLQLVVVCSTRYYSICTICVDLLSVWVCAICFGSVTRRRFLSIVCVLSIGSICSSIRNSNIHS